MLLAAPLVLVSLAACVLGFTGAAGLPQDALAGAYARALATAVLCVALAAPVAWRRIAWAWIVPLAVLPSVGAAGVAILPLPGFAGRGVVEGAILLLPAMVFILRRAWRGIPGGLRETALACGAAPQQAAWLACVSPALPGAGAGVLIGFLLALGLAPLLAPHAVAP
jgi:hypothetical protein